MQKLPQRSVSQVQTSVCTAAVSAMTNLMRKFANRRSLRLSAWKSWVSHVLWGHTCIFHIDFATTVTLSCEDIWYEVHFQWSGWSCQEGCCTHPCSFPLCEQCEEVGSKQAPRGPLPKECDTLFALLFRLLVCPCSSYRNVQPSRQLTGHKTISRVFGSNKRT